MNKTQAISSSRKLNAELFKLTPSYVITLFEIDFSNLVTYANRPPFNNKTTFLFHNHVKSIDSSIWWQGRNYIAAPITAEGFEYSSKGSIATPKLSLSVPDSATQLFRLFKQQFRALDNDLTGAKVTRVKTFYKFIDERNFAPQNRPSFLDPDPNAELSRDIYYIDRKSHEDKNFLEFELTSFFNLNGINLPQRLVFANRCPFSYRGEGCLYEYNSRRNNSVHGATSTMPTLAPPVATANNELIFGTILTNNEQAKDKGEYKYNSVYSKADSIYVTKNGLNFYFVARSDVPAGVIPPNETYWISDECAQDISACEFRWKSINANQLPFGGFPGVDRVN